MPEHVGEALILVHRIVGYPLAFVVAPLALATFAGARGHSWSGMWYAVLMTFLYLSGTVLTLTQHDWLTWNFGRNVTFNLLGYSLLLYGLRAMWLLRHPDAPRPTRLDHGLTALLIGTVAAMTVLAVDRNTHSESTVRPACNQRLPSVVPGSSFAHRSQMNTGSA